MRYSLLSRFQGGLLGSLIGETLASQSAILGRGIEYAREEREQGNPVTSSYDRLDYRGDKLGQIGQKLSRWQAGQKSLLVTLIASGSLVQKDWQGIFQKEDFSVNSVNSLRSSEIALATLPMALFFHDSPHQLAEQLELLGNLGEHFSQIGQDVIIWSYAISLALQEKLNPPQLLRQILEKYENLPTPLIQQLEQVETFLSQGTPLLPVVSQLSRQGQPSQTAIALALYCFCYTPEDFRLCILRAFQSGYQTQITAGLAGALAGVYNSFSGIPPIWRLAVGKEPRAEETHRQAIELLAIWAGVEEFSNLDILKETAIAAPLVIQPRPSLKIISQKG